MVYCRECAFSTEQRAPLFYSPALLHLHWIRELLPFTTSTEKTSLTALNSLHFFLLFKPTHTHTKKRVLPISAGGGGGGQGRNLTILYVRHSFWISLVRKLTSQPVTTFSSFLSSFLCLGGCWKKELGRVPSPSPRPGDASRRGPRSPRAQSEGPRSGVPRRKSYKFIHNSW